jgi:preprotein translocase subunit SecA
VYKNEPGKFRAIVQQVKECYAKGQPVLVGTISIEKSEVLSKLLKREGIPHAVLNAKYHEQEAQIVAQAGKFGAVTIATNMAGRGTDIMLGGNAEFLAKSELRKLGTPEELIVEADAYSETDNAEILAVREQYKTLLGKYKDAIADEAEKVRKAGGLYIIGTERHESRRIDNQLRGRSGRQGDPGESRFFLSLQDDLMRLFATDRVAGMMDSLGLEDDMPIDAKILSGAVENAQKNVESRHFRSRKNVLEYDNDMNTQRQVIYAQRQKVLDGEDLKENILTMLRQVVDSAVSEALAENGGVADENSLRLLAAKMEGIYFAKGTLQSRGNQLAGQKTDAVADTIYEICCNTYAAKETAYGEKVMRELERVVMLRVVDEYWMDNIDAMDDLKQGIGLRAYGQHDPVVAYKEEGYQMFEAMVTAIREETVRRMFLVQLRTNQEVKREKVAKETGTGAASQSEVKKAPVKKAQKIGPNDPCPCGSGKKYKKCCMQKDKMGE